MKKQIPYSVLKSISLISFVRKEIFDLALHSDIKTTEHLGESYEALGVILANLREPYQPKPTTHGPLESESR